MLGRDDSDELSEIMKVGFASFRETNSLYNEIIENFLISFMSKDEMIVTLINEAAPFVQHQENNCTISFNYSENKILIVKSWWRYYDKDLQKSGQ